MDVIGQYVLAMYDVRGKQEYIFRGNKIKEIVGGSLIIRDIYKDYLLVPDNNIVNYSVEGIEKEEDLPEFKWTEFVQNMDRYNGQVVYDGGGNFLILFKDEETFKQITHKFTLAVLKNTASLRVIGTCVPVTGNFRNDRQALYTKHRITENTVQNVPLYGSLPIGLVSPVSSMPIVYRGKDYTPEEMEMTAEQLAKYRKYNECFGSRGKETDRAELSTNVLDKIAPEKGVDSHIAVIYIDGNSMGAKVQECTKGCETYDDSIKALRTFSWKIQRECIDNKKSVIDKLLKDKYKDDDNAPKRRLILGAGDEINLIVAGRDALDVACAYLKNLGNDQTTKMPGVTYSSCAGIAIFRSHMPYADAYRIAEECCESGKSKMKELKVENTSFLDFHMCQGAIDISLGQIRKDEETENISRPWLIVDSREECANREVYSFDEIEKVKEFLQSIAHGNTKGLLSASRDGEKALEMELKRIRAHQSDSDKNNMRDEWEYINKLDSSRRCKMIYDTVLMYDLWFKK